MRHTLLTALVLFAHQVMASDQEWRAVSDFGATGIHASNTAVIAWNAQQYAVSTDGGATWSNPIAPAAQGQPPEPIRLCIAAPTGLLVLTATGRVYNVTETGMGILPTPALTNLAVAGDGTIYSEGIDGTVSTFNGAAITKGRIYRAVQDGVLVKPQRDSLVLATSSGVQPVPFKGENLPMSMDLPPLTTKGGDRWATKKATTWMFADGKVMAYSERQAQVRAYGFGGGGYYELLMWQGLQITYQHGKTGLAGHWRTKGLNQEAVLLTVTDSNFIAASPAGIFSVVIAR